MIILNEYKAIFLRCRKVASTSLMDALIANSQKEDFIWYPYKIQSRDQVLSSNLTSYGKYKYHLNINDAKYFSSYLWEEYDKFCFLRNPWDWCASMWRYDCKNKNSIEQVKQGWHKKSFKEYIIARRYLVASPWDMICENGKPAVNTILKYEELPNNLWNYLDQRGSVHEKYLPWKKKTSEEKNYRQYYDEETSEIVRKDFHQMIDHIGYEF